MVGEDGGSRLIFIVLGTAAWRERRGENFTLDLPPQSYLEYEVLDGRAGEVGGEE